MESTRRWVFWRHRLDAVPWTRVWTRWNAICVGRRRAGRIRTTSVPCSGLRDHRPADGRVGLCWGDARLANVLYAEDLQSVAAILDWEMACLGDPAQDLAWWLFVDEALSSGLGAARLDGFPSVADTLSEWRAQDVADGVEPLDDASFHYYWVAAAFYFGLIITRSMICRGSADPVADNFVTPLLRSALAE